MPFKLFLIDTHCHVNFIAYKNDGEEVVRRAREKGIGMIVVGSQIDTSRGAVECVEKYGGEIWAAVGLHPVHLVDEEIEEEGVKFRTRAETFDYGEYKKLAGSSKVVAIGEMGLDYFRLPADESEVKKLKQSQRETFEQGIRLASVLDKALIVHTRPSSGTYDAYQDVIEIIESRIMNHESRLRGVVHCFGGDVEQAKQVVELGFYIGVTGIVTFKNTKVLQEVVKMTPLNRLLVETDAPYLAPEPHRGTRNEPAYVEYVARKIAELKGISFEEVAQRTTENARKLFKI